MAQPTAIPADLISDCREELAQDTLAQVAKNAATSAGIRKAARVPEGVAANNLDFDIDLKQGKRANQERSGRCWMFASLNVFRQKMIEKYNLPTFELSQAYPLFWDKLEKSNWFLNNICDTLDEPLDGRLVSYLLTDPIGDGGQWDMFRALVQKYGVCPKEAMPETANSCNTGDLDRYLTRYLRGCARRLRDSHAAGVSTSDLEQMRNEMLSDIYRLLTISLGEPPASFDVRLRDKDNKLVLSGTFTPQDFFKEAVGIDLSNWISVISAPTADKPYGKSYTVSRLGNVVEGGGVRYLNLTPDELRELTIAQLKDGHPVWFGCDVAQSYLRDEGIMDTASLNVDDLFGFPVEGALNREQRLDYGESLMTHAMVFEGVRLNESGKPQLWKVENSWGTDHGRDGFDTMSDEWFGEYVYQIVVDKSYLTPDQLAAYEAEPTVLAPWDPMGSLARVH